MTTKVVPENDDPTTVAAMVDASAGITTDVHSDMDWSAIDAENEH